MATGELLGEAPASKKWLPVPRALQSCAGRMISRRASTSSCTRARSTPAHVAARMAHYHRRRGMRGH